jgi:hypothetical protein
MAHGRLGAANLAANTPQIIYTVPAQTVATVTVNICCRADPSASVGVAIVDGIAIDALQLKDFILFNYDMAYTDVQNMAGITLGSGQSIYATSTASDVSINVWGITSAV